MAPLIIIPLARAKVRSAPNVVRPALQAHTALWLCRCGVAAVAPCFAATYTQTNGCTDITTTTPPPHHHTIILVNSRLPTRLQHQPAPCLPFILLSHCKALAPTPPSSSLRLSVESRQGTLQSASKLNREPSPPLPFILTNDCQATTARPLLCLGKKLGHTGLLTRASSSSSLASKSSNKQSSRLAVTKAADSTPILPSWEPACVDLCPLIIPAQSGARNKGIRNLPLLKSSSTAQGRLLGLLDKRGTAGRPWPTQI